jgi:methyl-accepting chemotaxis protein
VSAIGSVGIGLWVASDIGRMMDGVADAIATSSVEIAATVDQQERTANQQAAAVSQTSTTMDELGASSQNTVQQAQSAAAGARQALKLAADLSL